MAGAITGAVTENMGVAMSAAETAGQITGLVQGLLNQQQDGSGVPPPSNQVQPQPPGAFTSGVRPPPRQDALTSGPTQ